MQNQKEAACRGEGAYAQDVPRSGESRASSATIEESSGEAVPGRLSIAVKQSFIDALKRFGTLKRACDEVGITRWAAKKQREADPDFDRLWTEAIEGIADELEAEAMRRAVHGYELRTTVRQREKKEQRTNGDSCKDGASGETEREMESVAHKYSEGLLVLLLKANRPDKFGGRIASQPDADDEIARDRDPPLVDRGRGP